MREKVTIQTLYEKMKKGEKITMLTCYDYPTAVQQEKAAIDIILVGDSMGMTVFGHDGTLGMTMDLMVAHAAAVRKGAPGAYLVGDMPYMSYQPSKEEAIRNAGRFMSEAGCDAVKLEGGAAVADTVKLLTKAGIPVMGHLGLTPQSMSLLGGFKSQGRTAEEGINLLEDAAALQEAGAVLILLEAIPPEVSKAIVEESTVPIISIGAGPDCHGQLLISHDMLGFYDEFTPRFVKKYCNVSAILQKAFKEYAEDVKNGSFPEPRHNYNMKPGERKKFLELVEKRRA